MDEVAARGWNQTATSRFSALWGSARRAANLHGPRPPRGWRMLLKAWEYQRRGILHAHLVLPFGTPAERAYSSSVVALLATRATGYGFGFVDRGKLPAKGARRSSRRLEAVSPHRAAAYVAGYLAGTGAGKGGIAEVAKENGVPGAVLYVSQTLTAESGVTMRSLRERRRVAARYPRAADSAEGWRAACMLDALETCRPTFTEETRAALLAAALAQGWTEVVDAETGEVRRPTGAPMPPALRAADLGEPRPNRRAALRLDSVLHRADETAAGGVWRTVVSTESRRPGRDQGGTTVRRRAAPRPSPGLLAPGTRPHAR